MIPLLALAALVTSRSDEPLYKQSSAPVDARIKDLVSRMNLEEEARQLDMYAGAGFFEKRVDGTHAAPGAHLVESSISKDLGDLGAGSIHDLYPSPEQANEVQKWVMSHNRLGIPVLFIEEGVRGYCGLGQTVFPHSVNLASTWDADLAKEEGAAIGSEARADGVGMLLCPVLDVARDPRWGRVEEDFGEDPYLSGAMGAAYVTGMQGESLSSDHSCVAEPKHFAGHGASEGGLNASPIHAGERELRQILLRSFQPAVQDAHAMGIMAAYHEIDGVPCTGNPWLLTQVLRKEWGFKGFVLSDLGAIGELYHRHHVAATPADAVRMALAAGVDMQFYDFRHDVYQNAIVEGVRTGKLARAVVDQAVSRVLRVKFELGLFDRPFVDPLVAARTTHSAAHVDLALRAARESMVLLRNESDLLPLSKSLPRIAVIGPNAKEIPLGDYAVEPDLKPPGLVEAVKAIVTSDTEVVFNDGKDIAAAVGAAQGASAIILAVGEHQGISGEGFDRDDLGLPGNQVRLLRALSATHIPVVVVLTNGRPLTISWAAQHVPAILEAWYPGERAAQAIAETLFGDNNPGGRLSISFPVTAGAVPDYYNMDPSHDRRYIEMPDRGYMEGSSNALFHFGFGLSYTHFQYANPIVKVGGREAVTVTVDVSNLGRRDGDEVVQLYLHMETSSVEVPVKALKGFERIHLRAGETRTVAFELRRRELEIWGAKREWAVEPGSYSVTIGGSSNTGVRARFVLR